MLRGRDINQLSPCIGCGMLTEDKDEDKPVCILCQVEGVENAQRKHLRQKKIIRNQAR